MTKHILVTTVFAAGTLIAGAALAQPRMVTEVIPPVAHVGNGGHVGNDGYVGPRYTEQVAVAQPAAVVPATPEQTSWQSRMGGLDISNPSTGDKFTFALNDLYSNGFRDVHPLWMQNGAIGARAVTPYNTQRQVTIHLESGEITTG